MYVISASGLQQLFWNFSIFMDILNFLIKLSILILFHKSVATGSHLQFQNVWKFNWICLINPWMQATEFNYQISHIIL